MACSENEPGSIVAITVLSYVLACCFYAAAASTVAAVNNMTPPSPYHDCDSTPAAPPLPLVNFECHLIGKRYRPSIAKRRVLYSILACPQHVCTEQDVGQSTSTSVHRCVCHPAAG